MGEGDSVAESSQFPVIVSERLMLEPNVNDAYAMTALGHAAIATPFTPPWEPAW